MIVADPKTFVDPARAEVRTAHRRDETACVRDLATEAELSREERSNTAALAANLVEAVRAGRTGSGLDAFLQEYGLSSPEGVVLLCLAEALLRIPDPATADRLIRDKIGGADWQRHVGQSRSLLVNASTWGLLLTGRVVRLGPDGGDLVGRMVARTGEPVIRAALHQSMRILGHQFVMGRTFAEALARATGDEAPGTRVSFDMLGEAARTRADADRYFASYLGAIEAAGASGADVDVTERPGISVKLSALHPRFEYAQGDRLAGELLPRMRDLALAARKANVGICIDAEEADRLEPTMDVVAALATDRGLAGWDGLGLAVQAYQKRARPLVDWLVGVARGAYRRLMIRLVKGAYWDTEIKHAQVGAFDGYPVFTRKAATDVSYLACARALLAAQDAVVPQFATHNAHTLAAVAALAGPGRAIEYQRLHGMGEPLYAAFLAGADTAAACRVYAPVGAHRDLLPYLVRRLLENGANTSFVNRIYDDELPVARLIEDPVDHVRALDRIPHPRIRLPADLYGARRRNAAGIDLTDPAELARLVPAMEARSSWRAAPLVGGEARGGGEARFLAFPADRGIRVGETRDADAATVEEALARAHAAAPAWSGTPAADRAATLRAAADGFEAAAPELMALAVWEAGKTLPDAVAEVREAVDFLRYYAAEAEEKFGPPLALPGPTGERNELGLAARGVFACISPWNFPLAIFTGQVAAALAAGNTVLAKPADQTPLIAYRAVELLHGAGVPMDAVHLLPGPGAVVGAALTSDERVAGVAFTGSTQTAKAIHRNLAARPGAIPVLIAETGGVNAMIADSSALTEQLVADAVTSAFGSAGQRCSALRLLFLQDDVADRTLEMLAGAMAELNVGDPRQLATDVGPVIDAEARDALGHHVTHIARGHRLIARAAQGKGGERGTFVAPALVELSDAGALREEVFGPILHVVRYKARDLDRVCDAINATGYGLTLGVHSRIDEVVNTVRARVRTGNLYVNRTMIGAVVGAQPFGGEGLSGTGPKTGGPYTLLRYATERTVSVDTTAAGGNAALLAQGGDEEN